MDTEQIQQQMRARRALIDRKLDVLINRTRHTRSRLLAPASALTVAAIIVVVWRSRRRRHAKRRLRLVA